MSDDFRTQRLIELARIIKNCGGVLVTRRYKLLRDPVSVRCANGHRFSMTPKNLLRGLWCAKCRPLSRQAEFLATAQALARRKGGKCLSTVYTTARELLLWQCAVKHRWQASFDNISSKRSWCPECSLAGASDRKRKWWRKRRKAKGQLRPRKKLGQLALP